MKSLFIARHAKSSWIDFKSDIERPLNDRGRKNAPMIAKRLNDRFLIIQSFVSSPALRAVDTCKLFCDEFKFSHDRIVYEDRLYGADVNTFYEVVRGFDDRLSNVAIFSHNPGITDFVNTVCANVKVDNIPTCGVFGIEIRVIKWKDFKPGVNDFLFFDHPKAR